MKSPISQSSSKAFLDPAIRFKTNSVLLPSISQSKQSLTHDQSAMLAYTTSKKSLKDSYKRVNPHEDGIISGGINRVLQYQKGNPYTTVGSPVNQKLEVIREQEPMAG